MSPRRHVLVCVQEAMWIPVRRNAPVDITPDDREARRTLPRHPLQIRECRIGRAGARLDGVFDHAVEAAVDKESSAFTRRFVAAIGIVCAETQTDDIALPPADDALNRFGHDSITDTDRI